MRKSWNFGGEGDSTQGTRGTGSAGPLGASPLPRAARERGDGAQRLRGVTHLNGGVSSHNAIQSEAGTIFCAFMSAL